MKLLLPLFCILAVGLTAPSKGYAQFEEFKVTFDKKYEDVATESMRLAIFQNNLRFIEEHNAKFAKGEVTFEVGVNQFADMTNEEFAAQLLPLPKLALHQNSSTYLSPLNLNIPESMDWREKGYVTPVKNQGQCGSCWSFSVTGTIEGQWFRKTGKLVSLSEQQLVDCSKPYGTEGCRGAWPTDALRYVKDKGLEAEDDYKYEARDDKCRYDPSKVVAHCTGQKDIPAGNENALHEAAGSVGPVSVCIDAAHISFQLYKKGVYVEKKCNSEKLDHAVLVAGYGHENGQDYWLVKNSWGEAWGDKGYVKMARNMNNMCGIASAAVYPLV